MKSIPAGLQSIIIKKSIEFKLNTCNTYFKVQHTHTKSIHQLIITMFKKIIFMSLDYTTIINIISSTTTTTKCIPHLTFARIISKLALKFEIQSDFSSLTRLDNESYGSYLCLDDL